MTQKNKEENATFATSKPLQVSKYPSNMFPESHDFVDVRSQD